MPTYKGIFTPKNINKYQGSLPIVYRSSWELSMMSFLDDNEKVLTWGSESVIIPYYNDIDGKTHRYFIDFIIKFKTGEIYLIEIKPKKQTMPPKKSRTGRTTKRYLKEYVTYEQNLMKWRAAKKWAEEHNCKFFVWTQDTLKYYGIPIVD